MRYDSSCSALALPPAFVGQQDWRVIQWVSQLSWTELAGYGFVLWIALSILFTIWWALWGADWLLGPRQNMDKEELEALQRWELQQHFKRQQRKNKKDRRKE